MIISNFKVQIMHMMRMKVKHKIMKKILERTLNRRHVPSVGVSHFNSIYFDYIFE